MSSTAIPVLSCPALSWAGLTSALHQESKAKQVQNTDSCSGNIFLLPGVLLQVEECWHKGVNLLKPFSISSEERDELVFPQGKVISGEAERCPPNTVVFKGCFNNLQETASRERGEFAGNSRGFQGRRNPDKRSLPSCINSRGNSMLRCKNNV